jgi:hypothetical protein
MLRIKTIGIILAVFCLAGCVVDREAYQHTPSLKESNDYLFGRWTVVNFTASESSSDIYTVSGELIAYSNHRLFVLDSVKMHLIPDSLITTAELYLFRKNPKALIITTLVMIVPNLIGVLAFPEYAGPFLGLAVIPLISGTVFTVVESQAPNNLLRYPKDDFKDFAKFARFPQGIPEGMVLEGLTLPLKVN